MNTARTYQDKLMQKREEIWNDFQMTRERMSEARKQGEVDDILNDIDVDEVIRAGQAESGILMQRLERLDQAIRLQDEKVQMEKAEAGREARDKLQSTYAKHMKSYYNALKRARNALDEIDKMNRTLASEGFTGFSPLFFPGAGLNNFERNEETFRDICQQRGIDL